MVKHYILEVFFYVETGASCLRAFINRHRVLLFFGYVERYIGFVCVCVWERVKVMFKVTKDIGSQ